MTFLLALGCTATSTNPDTQTPADSGPSQVDECRTTATEGWTETSHAKGTDGQVEVVFPGDRVPRIDIVICAEDFQAMRDELDDFYGGSQGGGGGGPPEFETPSYVPATVWFEGASWPQVGIRYKGNSSLHIAYNEGIEKYPFRLEFDHYEDTVPEVEDQRFWGYKELKFSSGLEDDSLIKDLSTAQTFRAAGVPAAQGGFMAVYVDAGEGPVYWGLYTAFEDPAGELLDAWFGDDSGNAYKPDGEPARLLEFDEEGFEKKTNEEEADWSDVQALIDALNDDADDPEAWRAGLEATFEVDGFLRYLALNNLVENWDTYGNMTHNYYLYGDPSEEGRLVWIPWDFNMSYGWSGHGTPLSLGMDEVDDQWPLIRRLADDPVYRARYDEHMTDLLEGAFSVETQQELLEGHHALVYDYAQREQAPYTNLSSWSAFEGALKEDDEALMPHVRSRHEAAADYLSD